jgi:hypothetical protein
MPESKRKNKYFYAAHGNSSMTESQLSNASANSVGVEWDAAHLVAGSHAAHGIQGTLWGVSLYSCFLFFSGSIIPVILDCSLRTGNLILQVKVAPHHNYNGTAVSYLFARIFGTIVASEIMDPTIEFSRSVLLTKKSIRQKL